MSTTYKLLFLLHIVSIVVAFAPAAVEVMMTRQLNQDRDGSVLRRVAEVTTVNNQRIYGTALILAGLFGIGLILASEDAWEFSQTWVSLAFVVWIAMNGVLHALIVPSERKVAADGDTEALRRLDMAGGLMTLLFLVMLYLMIWKPGV